MKLNPPIRRRAGFHPRRGFHHRRWFLPPGRVDLDEKDSDCITIRVFFWQGHKDLNPEPTVLESQRRNRRFGGDFWSVFFKLITAKTRIFLLNRPVKQHKIVTIPHTVLFFWADGQMDRNHRLRYYIILPRIMQQKAKYLPKGTKKLLLFYFGTNHSQSL